MDDRLNMVLRGVRDAVEAWGDVRSQRKAAVAAATQAVRTAEARLKVSLRGLALGRWRTLVAGRPSLPNSRVARQVHLAAKSKQEVEAALTALAALDTADTPGGSPAFAQFDALYYSATYYTTTGGPPLPTVPLRLLTVVETLTGVILAAWTASFLFMVMKKHWEEDVEGKNGRHPRAEATPPP